MQANFDNFILQKCLFSSKLHSSKPGACPGGTKGACPPPWELKSRNKKSHPLHYLNYLTVYRAYMYTIIFTLNITYSIP